MAVGLTACVDDYYNGGYSAPNGGGISFVNAVVPFTRTGKTGKNAADMLGNRFFVYGIKNESLGADALAAENLVFQNYKVTYSDGTGGSSVDNSSGWGYIGNALSYDEAANLRDNIGTAAQAVKYWDYNAADYTFYAFAIANNDLEDGKMKVTKNTGSTFDTYRNGYTIEMAADAEPTDLYLADRIHITASSNTDQTQSNAYGGKVSFNFRNAMAKVRVGMYETVPGYSLTIDAFRTVDETMPSFGDMTTENTGQFAANLSHNTPYKEGTMTVTYTDRHATEENIPVVVFGGTKDNVLTLGDNLRQGTVLGDNAADVVYDKSDDGYTAIYPMEYNAHSLKVKMDFTLKSKVGETIEVRNATAEVPAAYLKWKPGCAYTYIFKISDQTNATVGSLTGLYPITFDCVAVSDGTGEEEKISNTGNDVNIVTMGYNPDLRLVTVGHDDYNAGNTVYASFVDNNTLVTATSSNTRLFVATTTDPENYPVTQANVSTYINSYTADNTLVDQPVTVYGQTIADDDFVNEVPMGDGTDAMRSLPAVRWTAERRVYAVEYTTSDSKRYYKIVKVDGYDGQTSGTLSLNPAVIENSGGTITPSLTVDGITASNADVTYALDADVPSGVTVNDNESENVTITVPGQTTAGTYTIIATYNRRTYRTSFKVNQ